jgi:HEAT repeat protein
MATTRKRMLRIGVYVTLGVIVLILLVHPFSRQAMFGPKVRDLPLCYWQDGFRRAANGDDGKDSLTAKVVRWLGLDARQQSFGLPDGADGLSVVLSLVDDPEPRVREQVAIALGRGFAPDECAPALLRLLDDPEARVRAAAANSLGDIHPEGVVALPRLMELLEDGDMDCRIKAAWAVWRLGQKKHEKVVPILRQALKDAKDTTRSKALRVVRRMGKDADDAFPEIAACATEDPDPSIRLHALSLLMGFGRPAIPFLVKALHDRDSSHAIGAAMALRDFGPEAKEAVPALEALLRHSYEPLRINALFALQRIDPEQFPAPRTEPE